MKRSMLMFVMAMVLSFILAACGGAPTEGPSAMLETTSGDISVSPPTEPNDSNILIAYFSHTGNTEKVAQEIADYTGGDLAEIRRTEEYENLYEEAETEILEGAHPDITVSVENIADYDTVFVGYPIWWDEAPAMIATFLADNDFSGKTIVPFCTSASDDIGNSLHIFKELCPDAEIVEGFTANKQTKSNRGFRVSVLRKNKSEDKFECIGGNCPSLMMVAI